MKSSPPLDEHRDSVVPAPPERRPLATRERAWAKALASRLARAGISPNAISLIGLLCGLFAGAALAATSQAEGWWQRGAWLAGAAFVQLRLLANMLDGMVALESGQRSRVGYLYNEMPDRASDTAALVGLGYATGGDATLGFAAAVLAMFTAYVRALGKAAGAGEEFCGPMAKPQRMFVVTLAALAAATGPRVWFVDDPRIGWAWAALAIVALGSTVTAARRIARVVKTLQRGESGP